MLGGLGVRGSDLTGCNSFLGLPCWYIHICIYNTTTLNTTITSMYIHIYIYYTTILNTTITSMPHGQEYISAALSEERASSATDPNSSISWHKVPCTG